MAFHLFWGDDESIDLAYLTNGNEGVVTVQVGYDDVTDDTYSLLVALSPPAGAASGEFELVFSVIQYDHEEECSYQLSDGLETRYHIPSKEHRAACLWAVCESVRALIDQHSPQIVSMMTMKPDLPEKALRKYYAVANVFSEAGFTVGQPDSYHGRRIWLMERVS